METSASNAPTTPAAATAAAAAAGTAASAAPAAAAPAAAASSSSSSGTPSNAAGGGGGSSTPGGSAEKKEIYTYEAPWLIYGMNWSVRPDQKFRIALGSFVEDYNNKGAPATHTAQRSAHRSKQRRANTRDVYIVTRHREYDFLTLDCLLTSRSSLHVCAVLVAFSPSRSRSYFAGAPCPQSRWCS
jgi:hypothetical protein